MNLFILQTMNYLISFAVIELMTKLYYYTYRSCNLIVPCPLDLLKYIFGFISFIIS